NFRKMGAVLLEGEALPATISCVRVARDTFHLVDESVGGALRAFFGRALDELPNPEDFTIAPSGFDTCRNTFRTIQGREIWSAYGPWMQANKPNLGPGVRERVAWASTVTEADAASARETLAVAREHIRAAIPPGTVLCLPTAPSVAPRLETTGEE